MSETRLHTEMRKLIDRRREYEHARKAKTTAEQRKKEQEAVVHELLLKAKVPLGKGMPVDLGEGYGTVRMAPNTTIYGQVLDLEQARKSLIAAGREPEQIIGYKIREQQLNELVREELEHGGNLPPGIGWRETRFVTVSRK